MKRSKNVSGLRQGFTTGSAAAAAAKAGLLLALAGSCAGPVDIPLPTGGRLAVPLAWVGPEGNTFRAVVVKDAGDDPDATHKARISCLVSLEPDGPPGRVTVEGGRGVGRVTLPGLPVAVGLAAINPGPMGQIIRSAREAMALSGYRGAVRVMVEVENGHEIAKRTLNPKLGVLGGISILGTAGVVKPFSHQAWRATIDSGLRVAKAAGLTTVGFTTGRRSERLLEGLRPDIGRLGLIQAADFFGFSLKLAAELGFPHIVWGCYFGKLVKMAQGAASTHAHAAATDLALLSDLAGLAGAGPRIRTGVAQANTARHALDLVGQGEVRRRLAALTAARALQAARDFAGPGPALAVCCFDFEDNLLVQVGAAGRAS